MSTAQVWIARELENYENLVCVLAGIVSTLGSVGCTFETAGGDGPVAEAQSQLLTDPSGTITIQIKKCPAVAFAGGTAQLTCGVDPGFVIAGGGAEILGTPQPGALLTASYPNGNFAWTVRAKDHVHPSSFTLQATAIGLKLSGVSAATLSSLMFISTQTAPQPGHLTNAFNLNLPPGFVAIGGGASITSPGGNQLLFTSEPFGSPSGLFGWRAGSKDHVISDVGSAVAYLITIPECPVGFVGGCLAVSVLATPDTAVGAGYQSISRTQVGLVSSVGGRSGFNGAGRLLTALAPTDLGNGSSSVFVRSKDHEVVDTGFLEAEQVTLRIK